MADEEVIKEFREFAALAASALQAHRETLQRHEENFKAEFKTATSHRQAIEDLHSHLKSFAEVINQQSET